MKKIKVLMLTGEFPYNEGDPNFIFFLDHALSIKKIANIIVLSGRRNKKGKILFERKKVKGVDVFFYHFPYRKGIIGFFTYLSLGVYYGVKLIKLFRPHIIHAQEGIPAGVLALILSALSKTPFITTEHSSLYIKRKKEKLFILASKLVLKKAVYVTAVSSYLKEVLRNIVIRDITVIPNPLNTSENYIRREKIRPIKIVVFAGRIICLKGIIEITKAILKIKNVRLIVIGQPGDCFEMFERILKNYSEKIKYLGPLDRDKTFRIIANADFLINATAGERKETFSLVLAEALSLGVPVIGPGVGGPADFLNERNSVRIYTQNVDEIKAAIEEMVEKLDKGFFKPQEISKEILDYCSIEKVSKKYKEVYDNLLKTKSFS